MKKNNFFIGINWLALLLAPALLFAQSIPTLTTHANFKCEVYLEIYNGLYDWTDGQDYSGGGMPLNDLNKTLVGAVTVANRNDTDGDGTIDRDGDVNVRPGSPALGRNEVDLIKIVVKKVNPTASLSGNVVLKINAGSVRAWTQPWKGTQVTMPYTFPASQLEKIVYLEALDASAYQRIEVEVTYNGTSDQAKATAVWVTRTQVWRDDTKLPVPGTGGTLPTLENTFLSGSINGRWISVNDYRYGHGDFNRGEWGTDIGPHNKRFGGRILFEFAVAPVNAAKLVNFDVSRQRKTRTGKNYYAVSTEFFPDPRNTNFPDEPSQNDDNELPNDDSDGADEDPTPNLSLIYSADPPATAKKTNLKYKSNGIIEDTIVAFKVSKNSFREFVRVQVKANVFPYTGQNNVLGSRASDRSEWHCTYYTKRFDDMTTLSGDYNLVSSSIPLKFKNTYTGNGTAQITSLTNDVITDVFYLAYASAQNQWFLSSADVLAGFGQSGPPAADGSWTITFSGVTVLIKPGSIPFQSEFTWIFNTFRTAAPSGTKINEINLNAIDPTTGY